MLSVTQNILTVNENFAKYKMMRELRAIVLELGGCIFGGYVRDTLIHDCYSRKYYKKFGSSDHYSDEIFDEETKGRLVIPQDMDCLFEGYEYEEIPRLCDALEKNGFDTCFRKYSSYEIFPGVKKQTISVSVFGAEFFGLKGVKVKMDLLFSENGDLKPPFGKLDMLCNALVLTNEGIKLSDNTGTFLDGLGAFDRELYKSKIIKRLLKFETEVATSALRIKEEEASEEQEQEPCSSKKEQVKKALTNDGFVRVEKMINRGWVVSMPTVGRVEKNPKEDGL